MAALGDDCYFYCTSTCAKGPACPFRHVETAKTAKIICQHWQMGGCLRPMCKFRHSDFKLQIDPTEVPCYWESQSVGCTKLNCVYKHLKPRPQLNTAVTANSLNSGDNNFTTVHLSDGNSKPASVSTQSLPPLVQPVVIQPSLESEESNASPAKQPPQSAQENKVEEDTHSSTVGLRPDLNEKKIKTAKKEKEGNKLPKGNPLKANKKKLKSKLDIVEESDESFTKRKSLKVKSKTINRQGPAPTRKVNKESSQVKKSVKDRLGSAPIQHQSVVPSSESSESDSDSDSDDSIENIKVMSMEEIFRQKALDSMMKKRAAEGTAPVPTTKAEKSPPPLEKKQLNVPFEESSASSSSSEEEESEEASSTNSSESSSSDSDGESSDEDPQFEEPDVRRVVVDVESENAATVKAKASLLRKQKKESPLALDTRIKKERVTKTTSRKSDRTHLSLGKRGKNLSRRMVNVDYDSDDLVSCRVREPLVLNVRDRLGKPPSLLKTNSGVGPLSRLNKKEGTSSSKSVASTSLPQKPKVHKTRKSSTSSSGDEPDPLAQVKIKSLEEIKQEKMKALASQQTALPKSSPVKERLGMLPHIHKEEKSEKQQGRQILLINDSGSKSDDASNSRITEEHRKSKRRPWRSLKRNCELAGSEEGGNDERTTVLSSKMGSWQKEENNSNAFDGKERTIVESPFESLRRRALMKKIQKGALKQKATGSADGIETTEPEAPSSPRRHIVQDFDVLVKQDEVNQKVEDSRKTHKHKHKHKHDKKSKTERQIYLPPAMKSSSFSKDDEQSSSIEPLTAPTAKVAPQKRGPHPIAAIWADGLTLSAKGNFGRRPTLNNAGTIKDKLVVAERVGISSRLGNRDDTQLSKAKITTSEPPEQTPEQQSGVIIKSFSEIMAEKRRRRLELQAQKVGTTLSSAPSLPSNPATTSPIRGFDARPKAPITPIIFNLDPPTTERLKPCKESTVAVCPVPRTSNQPVMNSTLALSSNTALATSHFEPNNGASQERLKFKSVGTPAANKKTNKAKLFKRKKSLEQSNEPGHPVDIGRSSVQHQVSSPAPFGTAATQDYTSSVSQKPNLSAKAPTHSKTKYNSFESEDLTDSSYCNPSTENASPGSGSTFCQVPTTSAVSLVSPMPVGNKHKIQEVLNTETEPLKKKNRLSIEDEFSFFDDEELDDDNFITGDVEPIDDLLQDIDDLLS
ncbi:unnamed protein product [Lymnaea stagnalis]|uniref:C3H1-type domain-containing protein n=1 Tax=Lymnaea stagnalis TaxID=6523 RepID=A0AAV2IS80_LYMST